MDYNLPRWLKNDLGLLHMSEADLNGLMFHPRHGGLCRRLVKFLAESTLCRQRYSTVHVKEELEGAKHELEVKSDLLRATTLELGSHLKESEDIQSELDFIKDKFSYMTSIEQLYKDSIENLQTILNRPNYNLENTRQNIQENSAKYLANNDLTALYSNELKDTVQKMVNEMDLEKLDTRSSQFSLAKRQQVQQTEIEYKDLLRKIDIIHRAVTIVLGEIIKKMSRIDYDQIEVHKRPTMDEFVAFKMPVCEEIIVEANSEEEEMRLKNESLYAQVCELEQQVKGLAGQYKIRRSEITQAAKDELRRELHLKESLRSIENLAEKHCNC